MVYILTVAYVFKGLVGSWLHKPKEHFQQVRGKSTDLGSLDILLLAARQLHRIR